MADLSDSSELILKIQSLSNEEKILLAKHVPKSEIEQIFQNMKTVIAQEAKNRIQSKIALTFNKGYSKGQLFNSIYYKIEDDTIIVSSTKNYFSYLNDGIKPFDMKAALIGRRIKMRLPSGAVIYRTVGGSNPDPRKNKKNPAKQGGWMYPGYPATRIYETVESEMQTWLHDFISITINALLERAKGRENQEFMTSTLGKRYYNVREKGKFAKSENKLSSFTKLIKEDILRNQLLKLEENKKLNKNYKAGK